MTYRNVAVKVDGGSPILATRVGVDFSTKNEVKRKLGSNVDSDDQLRFNGDLDSKISVDFIVRSSDGGYGGVDFLLDEYHATGKNHVVIEVGGNSYNQCFIDSFSLTIKPFEPVVGSATFTSYQHPTAALAGSTSTDVDADLDTADIIYGHTCSLSNAGDVVSANIVDNLTYSKTYSRTPVYTLGSSQATSQLIDAVEVDMSVQSTGLNSLIGFSGSKLTGDFGVLLEDVSNSGVVYSSNDFDLTVSSGAHVVAEGYSVDGGGTLVTKATIKEVIL